VAKAQGQILPASLAEESREENAPFKGVVEGLVEKNMHSRGDMLFYAAKS
jgi:hypothetical protein